MLNFWTDTILCDFLVPVHIYVGIIKKKKEKKTFSYTPTEF